MNSAFNGRHAEMWDLDFLLSACACGGSSKHSCGQGGHVLKEQDEAECTHVTSCNIGC